LPVFSRQLSGQGHEEARAAEETVVDRSLVTSESVLVEFLHFFGSFRSSIRTEAANIAGELYEDASIEVVTMSPRLFRRGLRLFERRPDKAYSMVDCMSMIIMRERDITDVLTNDDHFAQEGFTLVVEADDSS
jgi:predicted nucleic acid-binding protein